MWFEARAKLRSQLSSLSRMARRNRQFANRHPPILEALKTCIFLLTISSPIATNQWCCGILDGRCRRKDLSSGAHQQTRLQCWTLSTGYWMAHSSLLPTCSTNFSHFTAFSPTTGTFHYSMDFCQGKRHFYTRTYLKSSIFVGLISHIRSWWTRR